jgi:SAM-dependent methyltransferase
MIAPTDPAEHTEKVARYYQRNTSSFLRLGDDGGSSAIHIALWPEGVHTVEEAMNVAHQLVHKAIEQIPVPVHRVADLGCGVGAALRYLSHTLPDHLLFEGLTIGTLSTAQINAMQASRIRIQAGDFHEAASLLPSCEAAFAIEAFAHSINPGRFFAEAAALLTPGGRLVIIDDICTHNSPPSAALQCYRANWLVPSVQPLSVLDGHATSAGLVRIENRNLTDWIRLGRPRDKWLRWSMPLWGWTARWWDYARAMRGGDARQRCLESDETRFSMLIYERPETRDAVQGTD